jgi:hypothetical protein
MDTDILEPTRREQWIPTGSDREQRHLLAKLNLACRFRYDGESALSLRPP